MSVLDSFISIILQSRCASPKLRTFKCFDVLIYDKLTVFLQPKLVAVSNFISFANPKAPVYPRLALGKSWDEVSSCFSDSSLCTVLVGLLLNFRSFTEFS